KNGDKKMKRKHNMYKAIVAIAIAMAFIMPVAAVANVGTIGVTSSNSESTGDIENMVESTTISDTSDNIETDNDAEKPVIDTEESSVVNDADSIVSATGKTIYVDDDRPSEWYNETQVRTIQEGINNASAEDTVYVYNGTYSEHVTVNKQLDLVGESRENVIVDGSGTGNVIKVTVNDVNISTFAITNGNYGVYLSSSSNNIMNCDVYDNSGMYGSTYGIYLTSSSDNNIINCNVYNNSGGYGGVYGIYLYGSSNNDIVNCNVYDNSGG
ncbi:unnamed protein product, partial [marine sediment metagenome]